MRIVTDVLAMEVKLCLVVSISRADFMRAQNAKDAAHDADASVRANCSANCNRLLGSREFGRPRARIPDFSAVLDRLRKKYQNVFVILGRARNLSFFSRPGAGAMGENRADGMNSLLGVHSLKEKLK